MPELEHCQSKRRFARTSKNNFIPQLVKHDVHERLMHRVQRHLDQVRQKANPVMKHHKARATSVSGDPLPFTNPAAHYHIAASSRDHVDITEWLGNNIDDPAIQGFLPRLKSHLLAQLHGIEYQGDEHTFTDEDIDAVLFAEDRLYKHSILHVNYTSYDLRRQQDSINPHTRADIMVLAYEDDDEGSPHPYWYA
ncbi:hypothetical protein EWM64_g9103 [Hericium alpestre]|uniref:Uncharacterized protein n=1 Tax=Hericium alpestre TaxID=135208 RepID=A0A4Y9ZJL5_9AGAM|nr:hypothetical protein EWM64_g9103 [Hericium alpestre]